MPSGVSISSVRFRNFKAFSNFSISLERMNILVGPNNSGKSTVIGAFRVLSMGLRRAALRNPERLLDHESALGYRIPRASLPITLENAQTDYEDVVATVTFRLTNGNSLKLSFYGGDDCIMYPIPKNGGRVTKARFKRLFPLSLLVVPVLGPLENREKIVKKDTVNANLATHRASRNFRNYWRYYPENFQTFRKKVIDTWPGMDISPPEVLPDGTLSMFCIEDRITRELYWTGYGFQVWCQMLSHIFRGQGSSMIIIDEPDIYLHANPQRQLLSIFRESGSDVLMATHSSEIIAEADANDILVIDKTKRSAKRVRSDAGIESALGSLGSIHVPTITTVAQTRRVLYIEGEDFKVLRRFARCLNLTEFALGVGIAPFPLGGFPSLERIKAVTLGISRSVGGSLLIGGIFDRDYRPDEEIEQLIKGMRGELRLFEVLERKELENYLLIPSAIQRTLEGLLRERTRRTGKSKPAGKPIVELLKDISNPLRAEVQSQYIAKRIDFFGASGKDRSTITQEAIEIFDHKWNDDQLRLHVVPGKMILSRLFSRIQDDYKVNLTPAKIIARMREAEMPGDLRRILRAVDYFRSRTV